MTELSKLNAKNSTNNFSDSSSKPKQVHLPQDSEVRNYSYGKNLERLMKKRTYINNFRKARLVKSAETQQNFRHSIAIAGSDVDDITNTKKSNTFSNTDTRFGREVKSGLPYNSIKKYMKTFDLIGFHGGDGISSLIGCVQQKVSGRATAGGITHVGLLVRGDSFPFDHSLYSPDRFYCWESTMSGPLAFDAVNNVDGSKCHCFKLCDFCHCPVPSIPHKFGFLGSQFRDMDELTIKYDANPNARLIWMQLNEKSRKKLDLLLTPEKLAELMISWNGISYNSTCCCLDLCAALIPCCRWLQDMYTKCCPVHVGNNGAQFCSEFAASIYQDIGILNSKMQVNKVVPADYLVRQNTITSEFESHDCGIKTGIPVIFKSYVQFTARSKIVNVKFRPEFIQGLSLYDKIVTEEIVTKKHVFRTKDSMIKTIPIAGTTEFPIAKASTTSSTSEDNQFGKTFNK